MADNSFKINKSANFNPQSGPPSNPLNGDYFFDATAQSFAYYHDGFWAYVDAIGSVAAADPMTGAQFTPAIVQNALVKITGAVAPKHLAGMTASHVGKSVKIYNAGTSYITVEHENASEPTSNNRIRTPTAGDMNLIAGEVATFTYDVVVNRWLLVSISSQAGAQLIATTTSPGLVTLHQASLTPSQGIVLSDGDLNTATGVVGLDANRAVTIAAPLSAVTALTVNAHSSSSAVILNGGIGTAALLRLLPGFSTGDQLQWADGSLNIIGGLTSAGLYVTNGSGTTVGGFNASGAFAADGFSILQKPAGANLTGFIIDSNQIMIGRRPLKLSITDDSSNSLNNHISFLSLAATTRRGVLFTNQTNGGTGTASIESFNNGSNVEIRFTMNPTGGTGSVIASVTNDLYLNYNQTGNINVSCGSGNTISFNGNFVNLWQITSAGALQGVGTNRPINSVLDPVNPQDAMTKNFHDQTASGPINLVQNGGLQWWSRAFTATTGSFNSAITPSRVKTADRFWMYTTLAAATGPMTVTNARVVANSNAVSKYAIRSKLTVAPAGTWNHYIVHEFDRDLVQASRGKKLSFRLGAIKGAGFSGPVGVTIYTGTGGANNECTTFEQYTGQTTIYSESFTPSAGFTVFSTISPGTQIAVPSNATHMALVFNWGSASNSSSTTNNYIDITDVQVSTSTIAPINFTYHGGSRGSDRRSSQQYVENSLNDDSSFDSVQAGNVPYWGILVSLGDANPTTVNDTSTSIPFKVTKRFDNGNAYPLCGMTVTVYNGSGANAGHITVSNVGDIVASANAVSQWGISSINITTGEASGADWRCHWLADGDLFQ